MSTHNTGLVKVETMQGFLAFAVTTDLVNLDVFLGFIASISHCRCCKIGHNTMISSVSTFTTDLVNEGKTLLSSKDIFTGLAASQFQYRPCDIGHTIST